MSLKSSFPHTIPELTAAVVEPLLEHSSIYHFVGQEIHHIISDDDFSDMYAIEGRSGINPVVLALITVF